MGRGARTAALRLSASAEAQETAEASRSGVGGDGGETADGSGSGVGSVAGLQHGLEKVGGEWALVGLAYNLRRLHRLVAGQKLALVG